MSPPEFSFRIVVLSVSQVRPLEEPKASLLGGSAAVSSGSGS